MTENHILIAFLKQSEACFVDEIERIITTPERVRLFPDNAMQQGGGWLFIAAELGTGDWNLARLIGNGRTALDSVQLLPSVETSLLIPEHEAGPFIGKFVQLSRLVYFVGEDCANKTGQELAAQNIRELEAAGYAVRIRCLNSNPNGITEAGFAVYLLKSDRVQGYVKTIHATRNYVEFYIEIMPALRGLGLGAQLLQIATAEAGKTGKSVVYAVDEENAASLATARKVGLQPLMNLHRFLHRENG